MTASDTLERLRDGTGWHAVSGPARWRAAGAHTATCLLSRHPIVECTHLDLTYQRREARSALDAVNRLRRYGAACAGDASRLASR
jgi:hypothetical protein